MSLYDNCRQASLKSNAHLKNEESISDVMLAGNESTHLTIPAFLKRDDLNRKQRAVYYISDLHLDYHILNRFSGGTSDQEIKDYLHEIVQKLFCGDFLDELRAFLPSIVLFGGDVSSSFAVSEFFYRDFLSTWDDEVNHWYRFLEEQFAPIEQERDKLRNQLSEWEEQHPWTEHAQKPLSEYSDRKVPRRIKEIIEAIYTLDSQMREKHEELGLSYFWREAYQRLCKSKYIYAILGNHELWEFESYEHCQKAYSDLFSSLNIRFLCNTICWLGSSVLPQLYRPNPETGKMRRTLIRREENPDEYDLQLIENENLLIVGGIGFAGMNQTFHAGQGIYANAMGREEELKQCEAWRRLFRDALAIAREHFCPLVVLTHMPFSDWIDDVEGIENCFFFSGHTHRNVAYGERKNTFFFADNQIGYTNESFMLKKAILHVPRNPFASDSDGYRETSCLEYKEYYLYVRECMPKTGIIERQIRLYEAKLFVMKKNDYVGFFLVSPRGVYICNGGQIRKIGSSEPLDRYYENFTIVVEKYIIVLTPLRRLQEKLSAYVKSIGGRGRIHGTIVDITFDSHIMITEDENKKAKLTYYYSPFFGIIRRYPSLSELVHAQCPFLEERMREAGNSQLISIEKELYAAPHGYECVDIKNSEYRLSRRINALQRLFDVQILRDWDKAMEEV